MKVDTFNSEITHHSLAHYFAFMSFYGTAVTSERASLAVCVSSAWALVLASYMAICCVSLSNSFVSLSTYKSWWHREVFSLRYNYVDITVRVYIEKYNQILIIYMWVSTCFNFWSSAWVFSAPALRLALFMVLTSERRPSLTPWMKMRYCVMLSNCACSWDTEGGQRRQHKHNGSNHNFRNMNRYRCCLFVTQTVSHRPNKGCF